MVLRPLHIVSWCSSIAPSFIAVFSLSLHCPHYSLSPKPLHLRPSSYFTPIQLLLSKTCAPQCKPFPHLWFSAVLPNPLQIRIKHPTERTYCGCTHSLVTPSPVSILLVVCTALHHTVVSRLINVSGTVRDGRRDGKDGSNRSQTVVSSDRNSLTED